MSDVATVGFTRSLRDGSTIGYAMFVGDGKCNNGFTTFVSDMANNTNMCKNNMKKIHIWKQAKHTISSCTIMFHIFNEQVRPSIRKLLPCYRSQLYTLLKIKKFFLKDNNKDDKS